MSFQQDVAARRTLDGLLPGEAAEIRELHAVGGLGLRLREMGLVPGTPVKMIRRAPFGDPLQLELRGYHLSLRAADAKCVTVGDATTQ